MQGYRINESSELWKIIECLGIVRTSKLVKCVCGENGGREHLKWSFTSTKGKDFAFYSVGNDENLKQKSNIHRSLYM